MKLKATIVGAGFSGLTLAYYLQKNNFQVEVYEKQPRAGGLIQSPETPYGPIEWAANGLLLSHELIDLCQDIGLDILYPSENAKKKFIWYKSKLSRWPFSLFYTFYIVLLLIRFKWSKNSKKPLKQEALSSWVERVFSKKLLHQLVEPAFQGVYAERSSSLSATLVTQNLFRKKRPQSSSRVKRQTVSFAGGTGQLLTALVKHLESKGVQFYFNREWKKENSKDTTVFTGSPQAGSIVFKSLDPILSDDLSRISLLSIAKVALFFKKDQLNPSGFGCLFPKNSGVNSMGLLLDSSLFPSRYKSHSLQTWILGSDELKSCSCDEDILNLVKKDIKTVWGKEYDFEYSDVKLWKNCLPRYDSTLEIFLSKYNLDHPVKDNLYLHGNYTGQLGLSQLLLKAKKLADRINYEHTR